MPRLSLGCTLHRDYVGWQHGRSEPASSGSDKTASKHPMADGADGSRKAMWLYSPVTHASEPDKTVPTYAGYS